MDISGVVDKFKNVNIECPTGSTPGVPLKSRADLVNSDLEQKKTDKKIDFVDISACVDCFRNQCPAQPGPNEHCTKP